MRTLFILLILYSLSTLASTEVVTSKEEIIFYTPDKFKFSDVGKIKEFVGIIERRQSNQAEMRMIDLYQFKTDIIKVDEKYCKNIIDKVFAIKKSKLYELVSFKILDTNKGKVCETLISGKKGAKISGEEFHRLMYIGFINTKSNAIVFRPSKITYGLLEESLKFWNSLK